MYYNIKIDNDDNGNTLFGCMVNISIERLSDLFSGEAHSSYIIKEVCLNILQPFTCKWEFLYLVLKINGNYASFLDYDRQYPSVFTAELFQNANNYNWPTYPEYLKK